MKIICWNNTFRIKAENDQDCMWLYDWLDGVSDGEGLDDYIEIELGSFDSEGKLEEFNKTTWLEEYRKNTDKGIKETFVKGEGKDAGGQFYQVIGVSITSWGL